MTPGNIFVTDEKRAWMRLRDHVVIFDREPDFRRFVKDTSGSVLRVVRIWVASQDSDPPRIRRYLGSIRRCQCGGWMSHRELVRLFRRATVAAGDVGERADIFRASLSVFLREYFDE
jgi:hypothetical protein